MSARSIQMSGPTELTSACSNSTQPAWSPSFRKFRENGVEIPFPTARPACPIPATGAAGGRGSKWRFAGEFPQCKGIDLLRELRLHEAIFESGSVKSKFFNGSFVRSMAHPVELVGLVKLIEM